MDIGVPISIFKFLLTSRFVYTEGLNISYIIINKYKMKNKRRIKKKLMKMVMKMKMMKKKMRIKMGDGRQETCDGQWKMGD